jgi:4-hydroxybenzoate polyprenyltransferase
MLAGYFIFTRDTWYSPALHHWQFILLLFVLFAAAMGSSFILNQIQDVESDRRNKKLFILTAGYVSRRAVIWQAIILAVISCALAFWISMTMAVVILIFILITGVLYNFRPFILKDRPWGSLLANALMGWLAFALGWLALHSPGWTIVTDSLPYLLFNTSLYLCTLLPDIEGDRGTGKKTLAVRYSVPVVINSMFLLFIAGLIITVILYDKQALTFFLLTAPFVIAAFRSKEIRHTIRATKFAILFFALTICLRWPVYLLIMLAGFYLTKLYYRKRFDFDYPNFAGK